MNHPRTDPPYSGANGRAIGTRILRCAHTDPHHPPLERDRELEFHWRCPAVFDAIDTELPYCPAHRPLYHHGPPASPAEVRQAMAALHSYLRHTTQTMPSERADYDDEEA